MQFHIETMTCDGCVRSVTKVIQSIDPAATVNVDLSTQTVDVTTTAPRADLTTALAKADYAAN